MWRTIRVILFRLAARLLRRWVEQLIGRLERLWGRIDDELNRRLEDLQRRVEFIEAHYEGQSGVGERKRVAVQEYAEQLFPDFPERTINLLIELAVNNLER